MRRVVDAVLAATLLVALSPVLAVLAALLRVCLGRPVLFRQVRAGRNGAPFTLVKFRTMTNATGPDGELLPDSDRMHPVGSLVRSLSLDELPELVNVVRGEMTFVGPRPLPTRYLRRYTPEEARRHEVLPGLTGWAQVNGRNALDWETRLKMDVWYVDHRSVRLDLKILWRTVAAVAGRRGAEPDDAPTTPEFRPESG